MNWDLFSGTALPDLIFAPRTDAIYNAHGYLTKVPVDAILPYINAFTSPGDTIADIFAGSGMTAVAAKIAGRNAVVSDISVLGKHIGEGYLTDFSGSEFARLGEAVIKEAADRMGSLYYTCTPAGLRKPLIRTIWSFVYRCGSCTNDIVYFEALRAINWATPSLCPHCGAVFSRRSAKYLRDTPILIVVLDETGKQVELPISDFDLDQIALADEHPDLASVPSKRIDSDREMFARSALGKWGLDETKRFFSSRNALALYYLWSAIRRVPAADAQRKLLFAFTAILPRASRRYQWSAQRPLNAATQTYYIAPVYYEWNVFDLFGRKVQAVLRAAEEVRVRQAAAGTSTQQPQAHQQYVLTSAAELGHIASHSVDYIFTDPPFGSNLFYSDMSLFHEAWLDATTDDSEEAVIHTNGAKAATADERYEKLLRSACGEAYRVLKPGKCLSIVFGNSSGRIWSMVQNILRDSGFEARPIHIGILDKGQRSVKGLASGFESVSTLDLILTVRKPEVAQRLATTPERTTSVASLVEEVMATFDLGEYSTPSHLYLTLLKRAFERGLPVDEIHLSDVIAKLQAHNVKVHPKTGQFIRH